MRRSHSIVLLALLVAGCSWFARFKPEPTALEFPAAPVIRFFRCDTNKVCLTEQDASLLARWMDKLRAFQAARMRLLED